MASRIRFSAAVFLLLLAGTGFGPPARALTVIPSHDWSAAFGDQTAHQRAYAVAMDASGAVYMAGPFVGTVNFGGGDLIAAGYGNSDIFLVKFNSAGAHLWSQRFGDAGSQTAVSLAIDASGNAYLTGYFDSTVNFGGADLTCVGFSDIYIAKFSTTGVHLLPRPA
ncbi:MAG: SBBP repeat-containing protein [Candidatus Krumholzibacteria bacterium]|nr:SBBP repeat-containing protein [Candidatus Krumholzibacteria bacterium]MDH4338379.1 SBBP repeat-containing protein [Candidatus Krumholzibacteria bacterium]MDH5270862.1 SBBP repeat-containing protein [Candidatus Krumholzibacteria bacterium]MDH5627124.1 SBBP repeat-containing protein [Candidatus Krumholzibacteria bacterium]